MVRRLVRLRIVEHPFVTAVRNRRLRFASSMSHHRNANNSHPKTVSARGRHVAPRRCVWIGGLGAPSTWRCFYDVAADGPSVHERRNVRRPGVTAQRDRRRTVATLRSSWKNCSRTLSDSCGQQFRGAAGRRCVKPLASEGADSDPERRLFLHVARGWKYTRDESELLREFATHFSEQWPWSKRPRSLRPAYRHAGQGP